MFSLCLSYLPRTLDHLVPRKEWEGGSQISCHSFNLFELNIIGYSPLFTNNGSNWTTPIDISYIATSRIAASFPFFSACTFHILVVLVTGGGIYGGKYLDSVELLNMDGTWNCPMPAMPKPRRGHTQTGLVTCGGANDGQKSCITFISGDVNWKKTHTLAKGRDGHSAWDSPQGIVLIGGWYSDVRTTTEILLKNGDTKPGFNLITRTR